MIQCAHNIGLGNTEHTDLQILHKFTLLNTQILALQYTIRKYSFSSTQYSSHIESEIGLQWWLRDRRPAVTIVLLCRLIANAELPIFNLAITMMMMMMVMVMMVIIVIMTS